MTDRPVREATDAPIYHALFTTVFRRMDAERAHHVAATLIRAAGRTPVLRDLVAAALVARPGVRLFGRTLPGPLGLAGGFDKDAGAVEGLSMLGFSFVEVGTVTARPQPGNEPPRLWRVLDEHALRNRMGFNNAGATAAAERLARLRRTGRGRRAVVGVNIGKSKVTPADQAPEDYAISARLTAPYADYLVVNVSSPNTPGLRDLQAVDSLRPILQAVRRAADDACARRVPLLVKIAPDLADEDVDAVADLALELGLDGVVAVNTTVAHDLGPGGLSGPPELDRGVAVVGRLRDRLGPDPVVIGVGGISTAADARRYLAAGASVVQAYTAFIYHGPFWASRINREIAGRRRARTR
ncbi:MAG: quinone-dependent dihydroorotate dehydrogenase [Cellulomonadaceae bacterium]